MADRITDERLREIAKLGIASDVSESEVRYCAAKLLNARAEVGRLRAELRDAMDLLRAHGEPPAWTSRHGAHFAAEWNRKYGALLARHKETL